MKKRILTVVLIALTFALLFSVTSFATESEPAIDLEIEGANLSFEDSVYVLYAVSHEGIDASDVRMLFWTEAKESPADYIAGTESYSKSPCDDPITLSEKTCAVFKNDELRAKNMADYVYARAYAKVGDVEYYSEISKYSILQYAYNMLGKTATATDSTTLKNMLSSMLQYGADAQLHFNHATGRLADSDFYQINVVGGTLEDGFIKGLYTEGEAATLTAPATNGELEFSGWANENGTVISTANPLTIEEFTKNATYTAIYENPNAPEGPDVIDPMECEHTDSDSDGECDGCQSTVNASVNFIAVNDLHGKIYDTDTHIGVDELTTYIKNLRKVNENFILISSGDMWQGSYESNLTNGLMMTEWMNEAGFNSMTLGNHEYDWGDEAIEQNAELANFPILAINIYSNETGERMSYCQPSVVVDCEGFSVGIIGAIGDCHSSIATDKASHINFKVGAELSALIEEESERLRADGVDIIVLSLHGDYGDYDVALSEEHIDAVFEGHTHTSYIHEDAYGVYHIQAGGDNTAISNLVMSYNIVTDELYVSVTDVITTNEYASLADDPIVNELRTKYADQLAVAETHVATIPNYMDSNAIRSLVAETYLAAGLEKWGEQYEIFLGGGYISAREPYEFRAGDLYYKNIYNVLPFDNPITLCSVSGAKLLSQFVNTTNRNYFIAYSAYGTANANAIDPDATYYLITDTYSAYYADNGLTVIDFLAEEVYSRDLVAHYLGLDYPPTPGGDEPEEEEPTYFYDTITVGEALDIGAYVDPGFETVDYYFVIGKITEISNTTYGNMYIEDDEGNRILVYGTYDIDGNRYDAMTNKPQVGDTVLLYSKIVHYKNENDPSQNKLELKDAKVAGYSKQKTVAELNDIGESLSANSETTEKYIVIATITEIEQDFYGNLYITDSTGETIYVYGTWDMVGANRFDLFKDKIKVGDTIILWSAVKKYQKDAESEVKIELFNAHLIGKIVE